MDLQQHEEKSRAKQKISSWSPDAIVSLAREGVYEGQNKSLTPEQAAAIEFVCSRSEVFDQLLAATQTPAFSTSPSPSSR